MRERGRTWSIPHARAYFLCLTTSHSLLKYTRAYYRRFRDEMVRRASELGGGWTAETVGRALWAESKRALLPAAKEEEKASDKKRKR